MLHRIGETRRPNDRYEDRDLDRPTAALGRHMTAALPGSPPQTGRWKWAAGKQPLVTG